MASLFLFKNFNFLILISNYFVYLQIELIIFEMKKIVIALIILVSAGVMQAKNLLSEGFEYANHDDETPMGWICDDASWLCGYQDKDHNRSPHNGLWYAYTNANESWMFIPVYFSTQLQYKFSYWAVSDGSYTVELWAGTQANADSMAQLFLSETVNSTNYEVFSNYITTVNDNYDYFGIHAIADDDAYFLTIDDICINYIIQYDFSATPYETDTILQPGANITFNCKVINEGYESITIYMSTHTEHFTDVHFYVNGEMTNSFPIVQDETVAIRGTATLRPDVEPGSLCWLDVMFDIDCGCATAMYTYWATVVADGIEENLTKISVYPNPSTGNVTIEGSGVITVFNIAGQVVLTKEIIEKEMITLDKGIYFIKKNDYVTEKLIVQ